MAPTAPAAARPQRPLTPSVRPAAPLHPNLTPPQEVPPDDAATEAEFDDDAVIVPAPDASVFIPKKKPVTTAEARAKVAHQKQINFRRTLIPILLTTAVVTIAYGLLPMALGPDSIAGALPKWVSRTLLGTGAVLFVLAVVNMASVRSMLQTNVATK